MAHLINHLSSSFRATGLWNLYGVMCHHVTVKKKEHRFIDNNFSIEYQ